MGAGMEKGIWMAAFLWLLVLSFYDIRYKRVPVWMVMLGGAAMAGIGIYRGVCGETKPADLLTGILPGMALLLLALGTRKAGWADGVILMLLGSVMGFRQCILIVMFSLLLISALSAVLLVLKKADKATVIPYVPFLSIGFVLCVMLGG